jgi:hypothetical protein
MLDDSANPDKNMDKTTLEEKFQQITSKREFLLQLLQRPDLGTLRLDVNQALEELDELVDEFQQTFPEKSV